MGSRGANPQIIRMKSSSSNPGCDCCSCLHLNFLLTNTGMFKLIEMILGGLCQSMLVNYGQGQSQLIGRAFFSLLTANAAATSIVSLLLLCYILSENSFNLIRSSFLETLFNGSAALSYLSTSTYMAAAVNIYLYPVYIVTLGFIAYPAMIAAYTVGFALGLTHAIDAYHAYRHFKGFR